MKQNKTRHRTKQKTTHETKHETQKTNKQTNKTSLLNHQATAFENNGNSNELFKQKY